MAVVHPCSIDTSLRKPLMLARAGARESFEIARQLEPFQPTYPANLAELYVYLGRLPVSRLRVDRARRLGGQAAALELVEVLIAWRQGDYETARAHFDDPTRIDPAFVQTWHGATSFETL
jgi:hypothetical protein